MIGYKRYLPLFILVFLFPLTACATPQPPQDNSVAQALKNFYPQLPVAQINQTPVAGIYEIISTDSEILYFAPASGHLLVGEIWSADKHNLTRESKSRLMSAKLDMFPLDKAIKIGNGPNQVVEVTDPDCPFCRQGSAFFAGRDDTTRYVFLYPLGRLHPHAESKARYILSSADPAAAYEEVFSGAYDKKPLPEFKDNGLLEEHRSIVSKVGVSGTPQYWINGQHVTGFNPNSFEQLLNK